MGSVVEGRVVMSEKTEREAEWAKHDLGAPRFSKPSGYVWNGDFQWINDKGKYGVKSMCPWCGSGGLGWGLPSESARAGCKNPKHTPRFKKIDG